MKQFIWICTGLRVFCGLTSLLLLWKEVVWREWCAPGVKALMFSSGAERLTSWLYRRAVWSNDIKRKYSFPPPPKAGIVTFVYSSLSESCQMTALFVVTSFFIPSHSWLTSGTVPWTSTWSSNSSCKNWRHNISMNCCLRQTLLACLVWEQAPWVLELVWWLWWTEGCGPVPERWNGHPQAMPRKRKWGLRRWTWRVVTFLLMSAHQREEQLISLFFLSIVSECLVNARRVKQSCYMLSPNF